MLSDREIFYVVDLDPLPVSHARLTVVELPFLSETCFKWQRRSKVPPNARCVPSYDFSTEKVNVHTLGHPPYSPDFEPSDFQLFLHLKKYLAGKMFDEDDKVQE